MTRLKNSFMLTILLVLVLPLPAIGQAFFRAELSQTRMRLGERILLTVILEGENIDTGNPLQLPNLAPFFRVEGSSGPNISTQMTIINGRMSRRSSLQYQYELVATQAGKFTLPRIAYRSGSQTFFTSPIPVEILEPQNANQATTTSSKNWAPETDPFLKLELDRREVYAGEQLVAAWYLYYQRRLFDLQIKANPPLPDFKATELEKAGQLTPEENYFRGLPWNVAFIQSLALYPLRAGKATIGSLEMRYLSQMSQRDFFGMPMGQEQRVLSEPLTIEVKPLPEPAPQDFSGAVGRFELSARLEKRQLRVNESDQLQVKIIGDGNADYILEPKFLLPAEFEIYPPEVKLDTEVREGRLFSIKKFEYLLVARKEGQFQVPTIGFRYFDPQTGTYKLAQSEALSITVVPGPQGVVSPGSGVQTYSPVVTQDIRFIKPDRQSLANQSDGLSSKRWFWLLHLGGIALVAGALYYRTVRQRLDSDQLLARKMRAFSQFQKKLKKARKLARERKSRELAAELKRALLEYFGDRFGQSPWGLVEEEMLQLMDDQGVARELSREFLALISELGRAQFAGQEGGGDFGAIIDRSEKIIEALEKK